MKKSLILSIGTAALLSSSLFASMPFGNPDMPNKGMQAQDCAKGMMAKKPMGNKKMGKDMIIGKIMMLDLSAEQRAKIDNILRAKSKDIINPLDAFSETSFDSSKYIKALETNKETMLKDRVEKLAKVYDLLTSSQKKDLKTIIDMEKIKRKSMDKRAMGEMHKPEFRR